MFCEVINNLGVNGQPPRKTRQDERERRERDEREVSEVNSYFDQLCEAGVEQGNLNKV